MADLIKADAGLAPIGAAGQMAGLVEAFLNSHDVKESSRGTYRRYLRMFSRWIENRPPTPSGQYTRETILEYKAALAARGLAADTISGALGAVRCFFAWAESMKYCPNIARGVKGAKRKRTHKRDYFTPEQVRAILAAIDRGTLQGARDYAIINLMVRGGLRDVEISRANIGDIGPFSGSEVLRLQGKGQDSKDDFVFLPPAALGPIREYLARRGPAGDNSPLFASESHRNQGERMTPRAISGMVKARLRRIGIISGRLTAHSLRHSAVTFALMGGATIQEAQAFARHADINTTLIYSHNIDRANIAQAPEFKIEAFLN